MGEESFREKSVAQSPLHDARFQRLFTSHRDAMWAYCYRRLHRDDVSDAVAEVFLVVWRRIDQAPKDDEALLWLYGVARKVVLNANRSTIRRQRLHSKVASLRQPDAPAPDVQVIRRAEDRELIAAVARLKPLDQELIRLRTWEELSHAEIAAATGLSSRSVDSRLARARKKLSRLLAVPARTPDVSPRPVEEGGER